MDSRVALGVDVGGTLAKIAMVAGTRVLREAQISTQPEAGPSRFAERLVSRLRLLESEMGRRAEAAGLGLAGDVDSRRGLLRFAPNLASWRGFDFKRALERRLRRPVAVDNDANMAVWGAYVMELRRGPRHVLGVTLGTGVGGGLVLGGSLHRGGTGSAGEIGHARLDPGGPLCGCGARGCLEAYAGAEGILRRARSALAGRRGWRPAALRALDCESLASAARKGDRAAREVWAETGRYLAAGLANAILLVNPEVVLLLGGVSRAGELLLGPLRRRLALEPLRTPFAKVRVRAARNPNWGAVGAALSALER